MPRYMLVAYDDPAALANVSPDEMQGIIERYIAWTQQMAASGKLVAGDKLVDGRGKVITKKNGSLDVSDGPYTEAREVIGGTWVINAANEEEALRLASSCPHVETSRLGFYAIEEV